MRQWFKVYGVICFSGLIVVFILFTAGARGHDQSSSISGACRMATAKNYGGVRMAFEDTAAHDSGYLRSSYGARGWADYTQNGYAFSQLSGSAQEALQSFYALCASYLPPNRLR